MLFLPRRCFVDKSSLYLGSRSSVKKSRRLCPVSGTYVVCYGTCTAVLGLRAVRGVCLNNARVLISGEGGRLA